MMPQSAFMIHAPVEDSQLEKLRAVLKSMNNQPGMADPVNPLVPFARFDRLHMARFVILEATTGADIEAYAITSFPWPATLVFLGDCDGPADTFLAELVVRAGEGLRQIFSHCSGFAADQSELLDWLKQHSRKASANYINWIGRTVVQVHEEAALQRALSTELREVVDEIGTQDTRELRQRLLSFVEFAKQDGSITLTPVPRTPPGWLVRNLLHKYAVPVLLLLASPALLLMAPFFALRLRMLERSDAEIIPRPDRKTIHRMAEQEDHDVSNQFTAFGDIKPGLFRRYTVIFLLWLIDYSARHIYNRGYLARVQTIHFARWVLLDNSRRVLFVSNYDGGHEAYMDDFINKVAWGLNLVFSNGVGYPSTRWLIKDGAEQEQKFKYYQRRHQQPTQVWYKAYPGKTAVDLARNSRIRHGVEIRQASDREIREWLSLLQ